MTRLAEENAGRLPGHGSFRGALIASLALSAAAACRASPPVNTAACGLSVRAEVRSVSVAGGALYVEVEGSGGVPLITIHGMTHHGLFHPYLSALTQGRRVVYYDRRGFGASEPDRPEAVDSSQLEVDDLEAIRRDLGAPRVDLLAISAGGPVAVEYAVRHPMNVRRVILAGAYADDEARTVDAWPRVRAVLDERAAVLASDPLPDGLVGDDLRLAELALLPHVHHHAPIPDEILAGWLAAGCFDELGDVPGRSGLETGYVGFDRLVLVSAPTLVVVGRHDAIVPESHARECVRRLPDGELCVLEGSGHLAFAEEPLLFRERVEAFLR